MADIAVGRAFGGLFGSGGSGTKARGASPRRPRVPVPWRAAVDLLFAAAMGGVGVLGHARCLVLRHPRGKRGSSSCGVTLPTAGRRGASRRSWEFRASYDERGGKAWSAPPAGDFAAKMALGRGALVLYCARPHTRAPRSANRFAYEG